jgi:alkylmercury lyase-like protein
MSVDDVRVEVYRSFVERGTVPSVGEVAAALHVESVAVERALQELHDDDVIVLHPGTHDVWLAHPFCNDPAPFETRSGGRRWDAICIWDALGILEILGSDGVVHTRCPDCDEQLAVTVKDGEVEAPKGYLVHYGVPAARWYEDVAYT